ncbi:MAG: hypothetical protein LBU60_01460, partial [Clostridiales bacterium]|nr:hypothetical protein [Clostridiales bacterium]
MNNNSALRVSKKRGRNAVIKSFGRGMNSRLDSAILPIDVAEFAYNYQFNSGVLKDGFGVTFSKLIDRNPIDGQVLAVWIFNQRVPEQKTFCMLASKEGDVYQRELNSSDDFVLIEGIQLTSRPLSLTYRLNGDDVMIITSPTDGMFVWDGVKQAQKIESVPLILSMTVHFERLFVTTADYPDAVWFSQDLDPTNFGTDINEGGFIELIDERGAPLTALSYQNYVFIFREFGITKLTAFGAQEDFTASNLFVSSGRIYSRTVALCGDSVMFLASDGLYAFDGLVTQRILDNITKLILPSPNATAIFSEGKYYLSLLMQFGDCEQIGCENAQYCNNALIVVDIHTGQYSISRGFDIVDMVFVQQSNQVLGIMNDGSV